MPATRWDKWYAEDNLREDVRILSAPATHSAQHAAAEFRKYGKRRILDLACGVGRDTFHLVEQGLSVTGVDSSPNALMVARHRKEACEAQIDWVCADARSLPFPASSFDGVYCFGLLHEFTGADRSNDVRCVILEIKRVLERDGILILTVLAGDPAAGLPQVQLFSRSMFDHTMEGWRVLEIRDMDDIGCTNRNDYHIWYGIFSNSL